ncbi:unnamed protein product [Sphagnum balticum]
MAMNSAGFGVAARASSHDDEEEEEEEQRGRHNCSPLPRNHNNSNSNSNMQSGASASRVLEFDASSIVNRTYRSSSPSSSLMGTAIDKTTTMWAEEFEAKHIMTHTNIVWIFVPPPAPRASSMSAGFSDSSTTGSSRPPSSSNNAENGKVKVFVRMRPFSEHEKVCPLRQVICLIGDKIVVREVDQQRPKIIGPAFKDWRRTESLEFKVDYIQDDSYLQVQSWKHKDESQRRMFEALGVPCVRNALQGLNTTIIAYGQTGSGKTYTMMGDETDAGRGLMPRLGCELMHHVNAECTSESPINVQVSYFEIYQEKIRDLLAVEKAVVEPAAKPARPHTPSSMMSDTISGSFGQEVGDGVDDDRSSHCGSLVEDGAPSKPNNHFSSLWFGDLNSIKKETFLKVREHPVSGPYVEGLLWKDVREWADMERLIKHGAANRTTSATDMNEHSSRSHALFTIKITRVCLYFLLYINVWMWICLAGSEKGGSNLGAQRAEESRCINKSLSMLNEVILSLSKSTFVSYRNSVLTWLLRDSFGGNNKTYLVANISPSEQDLRESVSTLRYATKAHHIHSALNIVEPDSRSNLISKLKEEICSLRYLVASFSTPKPSCSSSCSSLESTQTASSINVYCSGSVLQASPPAMSRSKKDRKSIGKMSSFGSSITVCGPTVTPISTPPNSPLLSQSPIYEPPGSFQERHKNGSNDFNSVESQAWKYSCNKSPEHDELVTSAQWLPWGLGSQFTAQALHVSNGPTFPPAYVPQSEAVIDQHQFASEGSEAMVMSIKDILGTVNSASSHARCNTEPYECLLVQDENQFNSMRGCHELVPFITEQPDFQISQGVTDLAWQRESLNVVKQCGQKLKDNIHSGTAADCKMDHKTCPLPLHKRSDVVSLLELQSDPKNSNLIPDSEQQNESMDSESQSSQVDQKDIRSFDRDPNSRYKPVHDDMKDAELVPMMMYSDFGAVAVKQLDDRVTHAGQPRMSIREKANKQELFTEVANESRPQECQTMDARNPNPLRHEHSIMKAGMELKMGALQDTGIIEFSKKMSSKECEVYRGLQAPALEDFGSLNLQQQLRIKEFTSTDHVSVDGRRTVLKVVDSADVGHQTTRNGFGCSNIRHEMTSRDCVAGDKGYQTSPEESGSVDVGHQTTGNESGFPDIGYQTNSRDCSTVDGGYQTTCNKIETADVGHQTTWNEFGCPDIGNQTTSRNCGAVDVGYQTTCKDKISSRVCQVAETCGTCSWKDHGVGHQSMLHNSQLGCQAHDARHQTISKRPILMTPQFLVPEGSRLMGNGKAEFQQYRTLTSLNASSIATHPAFTESGRLNTANQTIKRFEALGYDSIPTVGQLPSSSNEQQAPVEIIEAESSIQWITVSPQESNVANHATLRQLGGLDSIVQFTSRGFRAAHIGKQCSSRHNVLRDAGQSSATNAEECEILHVVHKSSCKCSGVAVTHHAKCLKNLFMSQWIQVGHKQTSLKANWTDCAGCLFTESTVECNPISGNIGATTEHQVLHQDKAVTSRVSEAYHCQTILKKLELLMRDAKIGLQHCSTVEVGIQTTPRTWESSRNGQFTNFETLDKGHQTISKDAVLIDASNQTFQHDFGASDFGHQTALQDCGPVDIGHQSSVKQFCALDAGHQTVPHDFGFLDVGNETTLQGCGAVDIGQQTCWKLGTAVNVDHQTFLHDFGTFDFGHQTCLQGCGAVDIGSQTCWKQFCAVDVGHQATLQECGALDMDHQACSKKFSAVDVGQQTCLHDFGVFDFGHHTLQDCAAIDIGHQTCCKQYSIVDIDHQACLHDFGAFDVGHQTTLLDCGVLAMGHQACSKQCSAIDIGQQTFLHDFGGFDFGHQTTLQDCGAIDIGHQTCCKQYSTVDIGQQTSLHDFEACDVGHQTTLQDCGGAVDIGCQHCWNPLNSVDVDHQTIWKLRGDNQWYQRPCKRLDVDGPGEENPRSSEVQTNTDWSRTSILTDHWGMVDVSVQTEDIVAGVARIEECTCPGQTGLFFKKEVRDTSKIASMLCSLLILIMLSNKERWYHTQRSYKSGPIDIHVLKKSGEGMKVESQALTHETMESGSQATEGDREENDGSISSLAHNLCSLWILLKMSGGAVKRPLLPQRSFLQRSKITTIEFSSAENVEISDARAIIDAKTGLECSSPKLKSKRLQCSGVAPIMFRSSTPFLIQLLGQPSLLKVSIAASSSRRGLTSSLCRILCQKPGEWVIHFLKAGVNRLGFGKHMHFQVEGCLEEQMEFIYMPAERCMGHHGYVVARVVSDTKVHLNKIPMVQSKELASGDQLVLHNLDCESTFCTMYFFNFVNS